MSDWHLSEEEFHAALAAKATAVRRETARLVLDRVRQEGIMQLVIMANPRNGDAFDAIAREFGVES